METKKNLYYRAGTLWNVRKKHIEIAIFFCIFRSHITSPRTWMKDFRPKSWYVSTRRNGGASKYTVILTKFKFLFPRLLAKVNCSHTSHFDDPTDLTNFIQIMRHIFLPPITYEYRIKSTATKSKVIRICRY